MQIDFGVKLDGNVDGSNTKTILLLVAAKGSWLLLCALVRDGLVTDRPPS
jgi:hypothetical protein